MYHLLHSENLGLDPLVLTGPASFIAASLGWSILKTDFEEALTRQLVSGRDIGVFAGISIQAGVLFNWSSDTSNEEEPVYTVKFWPVNRAVPQRVDPLSSPDPWVKVGTTTIDGTFEQVRDAFGSTWENVDHMLYALASGDVFDFDGRSLMVHSREVDDAGVMVCCDIVRRQSEIDAEKVSRDCAIFDGLMRVHMTNHPCSECGPHGNAGRVLLLESWVDCGTCKPAASAVFDEDVDVQRARDHGSAVGRAAIGLRGAMEVAALRSSLTEATVDNRRRHEALMADFKAAITIPNTPHVHMTFDPVGHRPGEFSFSASDLRMPTHARAPFAVAADVWQAESTIGAVRYPTLDEYANYLSEYLSTNLGAVTYDDPCISSAARMFVAKEWTGASRDEFPIETGDRSRTRARGRP